LSIFKVNNKKVNSFLVYLILLIIGFMVIIPFVWMVSTSFKPNSEILSKSITFFPKNFTLKNYSRVFSRIPYWTNLFNSLFVSGITTVIAIFFSTMVGYGIAKFNSKYLDKIMGLFLIALMVPPFVIAIPLYLVAAPMGLTNNLIAVIIPFAVSNFGIFLMRQFCIAIPGELLDAARIDGLSEIRIFTSIVLPVISTGAVAFGILKFLMTWNDFFWPLIMLTREKNMTLQVLLATSVDFEMGVSYGFVMALTTLIVFPVIVLFLAFQRRIIEGVSLSGLKG
jgi:multiple sugar transport system permease protein